MGERTERMFRMVETRGGTSEEQLRRKTLNRRTDFELTVSTREFKVQRTLTGGGPQKFYICRPWGLEKVN